MKNPCTHGCVELLGRYHCLCPTGMFLHQNGYECIAQYMGTGERSPPRTRNDDQPNRNNTATFADNLTPDKDERRAVSVVSIVISALFLICIAVISFLIINHLIQRRKEGKLKESKENMIKDDERKIDLGHSLTNMANSMGHDRSITGSSGQLDENQSLIGDDPPLIVNPYKYQYNPESQRLVPHDSNDDLPVITSQQLEFPHDSEDTSTLSGAVTRASVYMPAPPPTPSNMSVKTDYRFRGASNYPGNCRLTTTHNCPHGNPPNSPTNSTPYLNKLDDF